jgi:hypothetical protein
MPRGRRKSDPANPAFLRSKEEAITLGRAWVRRMMDGDVETSRRGTHRGDPVGFPWHKMTAAKLMVLFPILSLGQIGKLVNVSQTQMRVWNCQETFKGEVQKSQEELGTHIRNTIQRSVEEIEGSEGPNPYLGISGIPGVDNDHPHFKILALLPFFSSEVIEPTVDLIEEKFKSKDFRYSGLLRGLSESIHFRQNESLKGWIKNPHRVATIKSLIASLCTFTASLMRYPDRHSEILGEISKEEFAQSMERFQNVLFEYIDVLVK